MRSVLKALVGRIRALAHLDQRVDQSTHASSVAAARLEVLQREHRLLARLLTLPPDAEWQGGPRPPARLGEWPSGLRASSVCRQEHFETPWFELWLRRLGFKPRYHRKLWEFAFICQALEERGLLRAGSKGLGFGVGNEPMPAYFASQGCEVTATDLAPDSKGAAAWSSRGQYAGRKENLRAPAVCPDVLFDKNVVFMACDMNDIPASLTNFDFCWSACSLEHLGSLEAGMRFVERSLECLSPGGVAVHTTELNLHSPHDTISAGPTVLYRRSDLLELAERLAARGCSVEPFDFDAGTMPLDRYVDFPPYCDEPHLRLAIEGYASTSVGIIAKRQTT